MSGIVTALLVIAALVSGWSAKSAVMRNQVRIERSGDHYLVYFGTRIVGLRRTFHGAQDARDKLVATIRGRSFGR